MVGVLGEGKGGRKGGLKSDSWNGGEKEGLFSLWVSRAKLPSSLLAGEKGGKPTIFQRKRSGFFPIPRRIFLLLRREIALSRNNLPLSFPFSPLRKTFAAPSPPSLRREGQLGGGGEQNAIYPHFPPPPLSECCPPPLFDALPVLFLSPFSGRECAFIFPLDTNIPRKKLIKQRKGVCFISLFYAYRTRKRKRKGFE